MHVLIAGGIGVTPMMSTIRTLADCGDRRPMTLLYGSRDWDSITYREELEARQALLNLTVVRVLADPPAGWTGEQASLPLTCSGAICHPLASMRNPSAGRT